MEKQKQGRAQAKIQKARVRERQHLESQEMERLDALWEGLDAQTREQLESEARLRLGVLGQGSRTRGALLAMRRNLLRERLQ